MSAVSIFVPIWTVILGARRLLLRAARRLRPGRRHAVRLRAGHADRATLMMNSIAPIWDGNETWLVLGGVGLLAAFPAGFRDHHPGGLFPDPDHAAGAGVPRRGLRVPLPRRRAQDLLGPRLLLRLAVATFAQGIVLGAFIQGFKVEGRHFTGSSFDCLTPFSLLTGIALVFGYGLLGAGWLILKTEGEMQDRGAAPWAASAWSACWSRSAWSASGRR